MSAGNNIPSRMINKLLQFKTIILWGIVIILAAYFIYYVIKNADRPSHSFAAYYTASRLLSEGENVSNFYDDDWFSANVKRFVPGVYEIYHVNLPTTSLILLPLSVFDYTEARIIWTIFNFIIFFITIKFLLNKFQFSIKWIPLIFILIFSFQPLYANFAYGQTYILIFCLLVFAWFAYDSGKEELLGFLIGFIFILKSTTFILWILLLIQKKWRSLIWSFTTIIFSILISLPWIGIDAWYTYADKMTSFVSEPSLSVTAYQTIHSFFYHLMSYDFKWNPYPLFNLPALARLLTTICGLLLLVAVIFYSYKQSYSRNVITKSGGKPVSAFAVFIVTGVILSPVSLDYHYILLLFPFFIFITLMYENQLTLLWLLLIFVFALIALPIPYISPKVTGGWLAIFAYPKLYGALGLLGLFLFKDKFTRKTLVRNQI
jgi:hypothetical protein